VWIAVNAAVTNVEFVASTSRMRGTVINELQVFHAHQIKREAEFEMLALAHHGLLQPWNGP
jgi:hypothetical protein